MWRNGRGERERRRKEEGNGDVFIIVESIEFVLLYIECGVSVFKALFGCLAKLTT